ncbi:Uncharacterized protein Adt_20852 [Abeliophyllum distichum]|jgi:hypothetical protein|uniref:Uncharacterized protein n=2 Tax=Forsythieae TaxID=426104 RepID=A0ABD1SXN2_9LAMI
MSRTQVLSEPDHGWTRNPYSLSTCFSTFACDAIYFFLYLPLSAKTSPKNLSQAAGQYMIYTLSPKSQVAPLSGMDYLEVVFAKGYKWIPESGENINFWRDPWLDQGPAAYPRTIT